MWGGYVQQGRVVMAYCCALEERVLEAWGAGPRAATTMASDRDRDWAGMEGTGNLEWYPPQVVNSRAAWSRLPAALCC